MFGPVWGQNGRVAQGTVRFFSSAGLKEEIFHMMVLQGALCPGQTELVKTFHSLSTCGH